MHINKGYILPIILIFLLLLLAGFFIFTQQVVESPVVDVKIPIIPEDIQISTSTLNSLNETNTESLGSEETASIVSTTTSATSSDTQIEDEQ